MSSPGRAGPSGRPPERVRRVLVAQSVGLWIRLNRHLSGISSVELVETPTLEDGRLLARLERPAVVVFEGAEVRSEAERLIEALSRTGSERTRVVLVVEEGGTTPRPLGSDSERLVLCTADELVHVVTELLALCEVPAEALDLLVHYRARGGSEKREGFVVVLELSEKSLLLQCDHAFPLDTQMDLDFFLPSAEEGSARERVSLGCAIDGCRDERALIYSARVSRIGRKASAVLRRFLDQSEA